MALVKKNIDLLNGNILTSLTELALPIMATSLVQTAYNLTDMAWIGLLGAKAVAGVGVGGMFTWLSQGLATMARMGGQVQVAQCIGRGDRESAHGYWPMSSTFYSAILSARSFSIVCSNGCANTMRSSPR